MQMNGFDPGDYQIHNDKRDVQNKYLRCIIN